MWWKIFIWRLKLFEFLFLKDYLGEIFQLSKYRIKKNQNRMFWNKKKY